MFEHSDVMLNREQWALAHTAPSIEKALFNHIEQREIPELELAQKSLKALLVLTEQQLVFKRTDPTVEIYTRLSEYIAEYLRR